MQPLTAPLTCFKAYDVRGRLDEDLTEANAYRIGRAFAQVMGAKTVVVGRDIRPSSEGLCTALAQGLVDAGVTVLDLGLSGTEEMYFAVSHAAADGGITVTASHNPLDYNGMKMVTVGSAPISAEGGMDAIKTLTESGNFAPKVSGGRVQDAASIRAHYVDAVIGFLPNGPWKPLNIVVNAGNGAAGPTFDAIAEALAAKGVPWQFHRMHHDPDGAFPNGIPNPMIPENQSPTTEEVHRIKADLAIAWDGDFDRCFFFDHEGAFIPGEYVTGLLASAFLQTNPGATIVYDPRTIWCTQDAIAQGGGTASLSRCGHSNIKQALRDTGAIYGGEMSAHHYFREFFCCDSGMIPWLLICALLGTKDTTLKALVAKSINRFPSSGEINFRVTDADVAIQRVEAKFGPIAVSRDEFEGLSLVFDDWRLNIRKSNTEPLLRLNVEAKGNPQRVTEAVQALSGLIQDNPE